MSHAHENGRQQPELLAVVFALQNTAVVDVSLEGILAAMELARTKGSLPPQSEPTVYASAASYTLHR